MQLQQTSAVVLLSGGLDSAVALACAIHAGRTCWTISLDYSQRHRAELAAAQRVADSLGIPPERRRTVPIDLRAIGGSALTDNIAVPKSALGTPPLRGGSSSSSSCPAPGSLLPAPWQIPITYVPARNLIFLSIAAALAEVVNADELYIGVNAIDYSGYPDCRREFIDAFEAAANLGTRAGTQDHRRLRVMTPLVHWTKAQIIREGIARGVDFSLTHSCYDPVMAPDNTALACGRCDSCRIRTKGFEDAGVPDPTRYV
jgi:7-cyano-7-deazaguanine synthase